MEGEDEENEWEKRKGGLGETVSSIANIPAYSGMSEYMESWVGRMGVTVRVVDGRWRERKI